MITIDSDTPPQEFRLARICIRVNLASALVFLACFWKFIPPAHTVAFLALLVLTLVYSLGLLAWMNLRNYRVATVVFILLLTLFNVLELFLQLPTSRLVVACLTFTFVVVINVLVVSWPEVLALDALLLLALPVVIWTPASGLQASMRLSGLEPMITSAVLTIYLALIIVLGTGMMQIKRRTEACLREMNANLNQRVAEKVAEIQRAQEQLERILRHIPVGVVIFDEKLRPLYSNGVHFRFDLGPDGELREQPGAVLPLDFLHEKFIAQRGWELLERREDLLGQRQDYLPPKGPRHLIRFSFVHVRLSGPGAEETVRLVLITEDITAEEALRDKLVQTNHLAEMGKMAASLVHEVNNPLAGIKLNLELMELGLASAEKREQIFNSLAEGVDRIDRIIRSFLSFARQEKPRKQWTRVQDILRDTLEITANYQSYHGLRVRLECEGDLPAVAVDRLRMEQVFVNLINNARDAMVRKDGELLITCGREDGQVLIRFRDNGRGIKVEDLPRIFTPFFTTKEEGHGTGLGLATSYGIIQEHGGTLEAESREGMGATFTIRLPIVPQGPEPA